MKFNQVAPFTVEAGRMKEKANAFKPNMPKRPDLAYKLNHNISHKRHVLAKMKSCSA